MILAPESVARFAGLLADRSRAAMCLALLDGRAWTAAELADHAGIGRPTASEHLNQLVAAGLLSETRQGRHRYLRLANAEIAQILESLAVAAGQPAPARSLRTVRAAADLAAGRTCYDHLAGSLGVCLFEAMVSGGILATEGGVLVTEYGRSWFAELGGREAFLGSGSRPLVRSCLDWTERRPHLAGTLGAVLRRQLTDRGWLVPRPGSRAVRVTPEGERALAGLLGVRLALAEPDSVAG